MILIRDIFQAQFGKAGEMVEMMKQNPIPGMRGRVLTDLSGPYDTVVVEAEVESIDEYFRRLREMFAQAEPDEAMQAMSAMIVSGRREIFTIEMEFQE
jgi:hypothetical protein